MKEIAILLRCLQLYSHNAHHLVARSVFFQDHEFLGSLYLVAEEDYDSVIERIIGLFGSDGLDLPNIQLMACQKMASLPSLVKENAAYMQVILQLEKELCVHIEELVRSGQTTVGTEQMLGDVADKSEIRQYKLKQRTQK